jgi:hypothetical protein
MKIRPDGAALMHVDRWTDKPKVTGTFCDYVNMSKPWLEDGQGRQTALEVPSVSLCLPFLALECQTTFQEPIFISATVKRALWW